MAGLLRAELRLTIDILAGLLLGELIIRLRLPEMLSRRFVPKNIPAVTSVAMAASLGSSKAGAAIISTALSNHEISERTALWSVMLLPFPAYIKRWPSTLVMCVSLSGVSGGIFAASLLLRSFARFITAYFFLRREKPSALSETLGLTQSRSGSGIFRKLTRTLPAAWGFFAASYSLVPMINDALKSSLNGSLLPLSGWSTAIASMASLSSALALASGALASGELNNAQVVFALILGSGLGTATRILRQDAGYYFGLFPAKTARKLLLLNFCTVMPIIILNLFFAAIALSLSW